MIGTLIWLVGVVCTIWCVLDIFKKNISTAGKVIASVLVLLTSWVGLAGYYFYGRDRLEVNLMFRLNRCLAEMMNRVGGYDVRIGEVHHTQKKDAPSGTAITLAEGIVENLDAKRGWVNYAPGIAHAANRVERSEETPADCVEIRSVREGEVPGVHTVTYESADDVLEIRHTIRNRRTLAAGAVTAAEFLCGKRGVFGMDDLLQQSK